MLRYRNAATFFFCFFALALVSTLRSATTTTAPSKLHALHNDAITALSELITPDKVVALVSFRSARAQIAPGRDAPQTGYGKRDSKGLAVLQIKGRFQLITAINLTPPACGTVDNALTVQIEGDEAIHRLSALVPENDSPDEATLMIAVGKKDDAILGYAFVGSFSDDQREAAAFLGKYLVEHPIKNLSVETAHAMLNEKNYVIALIGLNWLETHDESAPIDFLSVARVVPADGVPDIIARLFHRMEQQQGKQFPGVARTLDRGVSDFLDRTETGRAAETLDCIHRCILFDPAAAHIFQLERRALRETLYSKLENQAPPAASDQSEARLTDSIRGLLNDFPPATKPIAHAGRARELPQ